MSDLPNLTCDVVRQAVEADGRDWAIVIAGTSAQTQFTTWGRSPKDKVYASDLAEHISTELCGPLPEGDAVLESFKLDAAKNKARVEELEVKLAECRSALESAKGLCDVVEYGAVDELLTFRVSQAIYEALEASK